MLVTIATVGYGDVTPQTAMGRFAAMGMIVVAIIIVPQMTNELMEKLSRQSVYARASYEPKTHNSSHVLVCGDVTSSSLEEFFQELFHEDHDSTNLYAVVLQPTAPSYEMLGILRDPVMGHTVVYLEGNALNEKDLKRAMASRAKAIFIMTNKFSADPDEEDAKTILQQFSIQRYLRLHSEQSKESLFCLQLIRPENKRHLVTSVDASSTDLVICLNEFKMGVIAKAVIFPVGGSCFTCCTTPAVVQLTPRSASGRKHADHEPVDLLRGRQGGGQLAHAGRHRDAGRRRGQRLAGRVPARLRLGDIHHGAVQVSRWGAGVRCCCVNP
jgi:hypothetical protein